MKRLAIILSTLCLWLMSSAAWSQASVSYPPYGTYSCWLGNPCMGNSAATPHPQSITDYLSFMFPSLYERQVYITQVGNSNNFTVTQVGGPHNQIKWNGIGNNNNTIMTQSSDVVSTNILNINLNNSSSNTVITNQSASGMQQENTNAIYMDISGNSNTAILAQSGPRGHILNIAMEGGNKTISSSQVSTVNISNSGHLATLVIRGPMPGSITMNQTGSTSKNINVMMQCTSTPCALGINQTGP